MKKSAMKDALKKRRAPKPIVVGEVEDSVGDELEGIAEQMGSGEEMSDDEVTGMKDKMLSAPTTLEDEADEDEEGNLETDIAPGTPSEPKDAMADSAAPVAQVSGDKDVAAIIASLIEQLTPEEIEKLKAKANPSLMERMQKMAVMKNEGSGKI